MPLFACGFESGDLDFIKSLGFSGAGVDTATLSQKFVHKGPGGHGGEYSLLALTTFTSPLIGQTCRWFHAWFKREEAGGAQDISFTFNAEGFNQFTVRILVDGTVQFRRGGANSTIVATSGSQLDMTQGHWIAVELVVANAGGTCNLYLGNSGSPFLTFTGDTKASNTPTYDGWDQWEFANFVGDAFLDDIIVTDATEGRLNETYGKAMLVRSDQSVALTPSQGVDNWRNVHQPGGSRYNSSGGSTVLDLYGVQQDRQFGVVNFVTLYGALATTNDHRGSLVLRSGTTTDVGPEFGGPSSYAPGVRYFTQDPDLAAAWTIPGVLGMHVGVQTKA